VSSIHSPHSLGTAAGQEGFEFVMVKNEPEDDKFCEQGCSIPDGPISSR
jgi:hypothetical protein